MKKRQRNRRARVRSVAFISAVVAIVGIAAVLDLSDRSWFRPLASPVAEKGESASEATDNPGAELAEIPTIVSEPTAERLTPAVQPVESSDVLKVVRDEAGDRIVSGELLVTYDPALLEDAGLSLNGATDILAERGFEVLDIVAADTAAGDAIAVDPLVTYSVPEGMTVADAAAIAVQQVGVAFAEPNYVYSVDGGTPLTTVNDKAANSTSGIGGAIYGSANQWWLQSESYESNTTYRATLSSNGWGTSYHGANIMAAWDYARTNGDVTIAIVDTGANLGHEDLSANIITSLAYDAYRSTTNANVLLKDERESMQDEFGHGTHVAGILGAVANNGKGLAGSSYNARIIPVRAGDANGNLSMSAIARAFNWIANSCVGNPAAGNLRVVNCSFGTYGTEASCRTMLDWISALRGAGVLAVCAGGNGRNGVAQTSKSYPSDYKDVLSVTSLEFDGTNSVWSDYNAEKDISAPGEYIYSTLSTGGYGVMSGTSMATPVVSGLAALCWAYDPSLSVDEVVSAIQSTATKIEDRTYDRWALGGSAGAVNALEMIKSLASFTVSAAQDSVASGDTLQLTVDLKTAVPVSWNWKTSNASVATVDARGLLTAKEAGTVSVWAEGSVGGESVTLTGVTITVTGSASEPEQPEEPEQISAPASVSASTSQLGRVTVSWSPVSGGSVSGYRVWRAIRGSGSYSVVAELGVGATSYVDTNVSAATSYDYAVSSLSKSAESERSQGATGYPLTDISAARFSSISSVYYTGSAHEPRPTVTLGGVTLSAGTDFVYGWLNNVNAARSTTSGAPTVRITGKGYYTGTASTTFSILQATQRLTFPSYYVSKTYGDVAFQQSVSRSGGDGVVSYSSSNTSVATVDASTGRVSIKGSGVASITARAAATANCQGTSTSYQLTVGKATLVATYAGGTAQVGSVLPTTVTVSGFVNGETAATAASYVAPTVNTSIAKSAGTYTLMPSGGSAKNYTFTYKAGTLRLTEAKSGTGGNQPSTPAQPTPQPKPEVNVLAYRMYDARTCASVYVATITERNELKLLGWRYSGLYLVPSSQVQDVSSIMSMSFGDSGLAGFGALLEWFDE